MLGMKVAQRYPVCLGWRERWLSKGKLHKKTHDVSIMRGEGVVRKNGDKGRKDTSQRLKLHSLS